MKKKIFLSALAVVLAAMIAAAGTIAWLSTRSETVKNTFTVGDINITLDEAKVGEDGKALAPETRVKANSYDLIPGNTYDKDPTVTVLANSEDCWLFVKIEELNNDKGYLTYELNLDGWTKLTGETDVWYREVSFSTSNQSYKLLKNDQISVNQDTVDKAAAAAFKENPDTIPSLSFTAYAVQQDNLTVEAAWQKVK